MGRDLPVESGALALPIDGVLDLHSFRPGEVGELLPEWMLACRAAGILALRVIHGKGSGALRARVHELLGRSPLVARWAPEPGNWGATLVWVYGRETDEARIRAVLRDCPRFMQCLRVVAEVHPGAWVGAGAVRNPLWHRWHGREGEPEATDLDVVWFDASGIPSDAELQQAVRVRLPGFEIDAENQALVQNKAQNLAQAVGRWPEPATCIAARWTGEIELLAPLGLDDVVGMIIRRNPVLPEVVYRTRVKKKRWKFRFPWVVVMK